MIELGGFHRSCLIHFLQVLILDFITLDKARGNEESAGDEVPSNHQKMCGHDSDHVVSSYIPTSSCKCLFNLYILRFVVVHLE